MAGLGAISREMLSTLNTPCYLFNPQTALRNYVRLKEALGTQLIVSLKANPNVDLFVKMGHLPIDGVEVASPVEMAAVAGQRKIPKYVNNPAIDKSFMKTALLAGAIVIVDNLFQLETLISLKDFIKRGVFLRANVGALSKGLDLKEAEIRHDHFGMDISSLKECCRKLRDNGIVVTGLHCFGGSHSFSKNRKWLPQAAVRCLSILEDRLGYSIQHLNLGGGFSGAENLGDLKIYSQSLDELKKKYTLMHESGRAVFKTAGVFINRVVATKKIENQSYAVCDGGMVQSFLLSQTESQLKFYKTPEHVSELDQAEQTFLPEKVWIVGNSCNYQDVIGVVSTQKKVQAGDYFVFQDCGAYHSTYTVSPFLGLKAADFYVLP